jgi:hypothetical protein
MSNTVIKEELVKKSNQPQNGNKGSMSNTVKKEPKHLNELLRLLPNKLESRRSYLMYTNDSWLTDWSNDLSNKGITITEDMMKDKLNILEIRNKEIEDIDFLLDYIFQLTNYDSESYHYGTKKKN